MIDQMWVIIIIVQLVVSLFLAWKVSKLSSEVEMVQVVVGGILMDFHKEG